MINRKRCQDIIKERPYKPIKDILVAGAVFGSIIAGSLYGMCKGDEIREKIEFPATEIPREELSIRENIVGKYDDSRTTDTLNDILGETYERAERKKTLELLPAPIKGPVPKDTPYEIIPKKKNIYDVEECIEKIA